MAKMTKTVTVGNLGKNSQEKLSDVHIKVYLQSIAKWTSDIFSWHFWPRLPTVKFWVFLGSFGQSYQR